jgi:hypothetical protein
MGGVENSQFYPRRPDCYQNFPKTVMIATLLLEGTVPCDERIGSWITQQHFFLRKVLVTKKQAPGTEA